MEKKSYTYGSKIVGILLHLFFTVIFTIAVYLLASLISKNILQITDIGTDDFFSSGYYTKYMEQKCSALTEYLHLLQKGDKRSAKEDKRYLQYTNEFKREDMNFCYWYKQNEIWYTNQPDCAEGQIFDTQTVLMEAKTMGDYLIYDMEKKEFGTNIRGMENYFFDSYNNQMYLPLEHVVLVIGVDVDLSAKDDLYDAYTEYIRLHPWIKVSIAASFVSLLGWVLSLVYLTLAAGYTEDGDTVRLHFIDKIKAEFVTAAFFLLSGRLILFVSHVTNQTWNVSGLLTASGTTSFVLDALFLIFYLSMVRRMKAQAVWETSFAFWLVKGIDKFFKKRTVTARVLVTFAVHMIVCFVLSVETFSHHSLFALCLLLGFSGMEAYLMLRSAAEHAQIYESVEKITQGALETKIDAGKMHGEDKKLAEAINNIGAGLLNAVDDSTKNERMKADLITNLSHDIKTPLTSIINYVNLIKLEHIENERVNGYIQVLDEKSQRLKQLTEDLVETSRITSGNLKLDMQNIDLVELIYQTAGEFDDKFEAKELTVVTRLPKTEVMICADGRQLYRVIENLYNNVAKYALERTRVYVDVEMSEENVIFSIKNVSERSLALENSNAGDLTERFIRGDVSRTTEGSGLGLSIAKSLTQLMGGTFSVCVDGDLFKALIVFPVPGKST